MRKHSKSYQLSPPSRWCGLKFRSTGTGPCPSPSPPSRWCGLKYYHTTQTVTCNVVTTFAVVWIEISNICTHFPHQTVTTFAVVWIEILDGGTTWAVDKVTTFAVVWIEIKYAVWTRTTSAVTTFAVVWIEMQNYNLFLYLPSSYFHNSVE